MSAQSDLRVLRATPEDATAVSELLSASYRELMANAYDPETLARVLPVIANANHDLLVSGTFYVVRGENRSLLGCGGWSLGSPGSGEVTNGVAHLRQFATHPVWARQGIGRAIFETCAKASQEIGASRIQAYSSINAVPFYRSLGLKLVREINLPIPSPWPVRAMLMEGLISGKQLTR